MYQITLRASEKPTNSTLGRRSLKKLENTPPAKPTKTISIRALLKMADTEESRSLLSLSSLFLHPVISLRTLKVVPLRAADSWDAVITAEEANGILSRDNIRTALNLPVERREATKLDLADLLSETNAISKAKGILFNKKAPIEARFSALKALVTIFSREACDEGEKTAFLQKLAVLQQREGNDLLIKTEAGNALAKLNPKMSATVAKNTKATSVAMWKGIPVKELDYREMDEFVRFANGGLPDSYAQYYTMGAPK